MAVLEEVVHSTLTKSRKKLLYASMRANALVAWAFSSGNVDYEDGGYEVTNPLILGRNPNVGSYRYMQSLPIAQTSEFGTVRYGWTRVAGSLVLSKQEIDENAGSSKIFDLLAKKMKILEDSIKDKFSDYLYGVGAGADPNGLGLLIPDDPTTGTLAGLSRVTETQWRTSAYDFNGTLVAADIEEALRDIMRDLTQKSSRPTIILAGLDFIRMYETAIADKISLPLSNLSSGKRMIDLGFTGTSFGSVPIVYDEQCPVDHAYFINDEYLRTTIMKGVNMRPEKLDAPWNYDAIGRRIVTQMQMCLWKAHRTHGVLIT